MRECRMLWELIPGTIRTRLFFLLIATVFSSAFQLVGVGSIVPFMAVISDPGMLARSSWSGWFQPVLDSYDEQSLRWLLGGGVFFALAVSSVITTVTDYFGQRVAADVNETLARRLLSAYLSRPYSWYVNQNSAELGRIVLSEVSRVSGSFVLPLLGLVVNVGTSVALVLVLFLADPFVAVVSSLSLAVSYLLVYYLTKPLLDRQARARMSATGKKYRSGYESLRGLKTLQLFHCEDIFIERFAEGTAEENLAKVGMAMISSTPKKMIEVVTFGGLIGLVLHLTGNGTSPEAVLPLLSLYGVCAMRLLPALQRTYAAVSSIRANAPSVDVLYSDITGAESDLGRLVKSDEVIRMKRSMSLNEVSFAYVGSSSQVLDQLSIEIEKNTSVGFVGRTGAGKTTVIDIILGFLVPTSGSLMVDDEVIAGSEKIRAWQKNLGYVPQHIFIVDDTVRRNIAFGLEPSQIDDERVREAAEAAALHDFIESELPQGYETVVGEGGIRLSGGQRQRLGIARALYRDPEILILDEATSALDGVTEVAVMDAMKRLSGTKTLILIAHRLSTLKECDKILLLDNGKVASEGTYDSLMESDPTFRAFARAVANEGGNEET